MIQTAVVVDDSPIEAQQLARMLKELGVTILAVANDGQMGCDAILKHKPTICTLDINLPHMSGIEIARRMNEEKLATKIIICTGMKQGAVKRQLASLGVSRFLAKPFDNIVTSRELKPLIDG